MINTLKQVEDLLEKVSVQGEENWRRLTFAKEILRNLRGHIQKTAEEQKVKEERDHAAAEDGVCG